MSLFYSFSICVIVGIVFYDKMVLFYVNSIFCVVLDIFFQSFLHGGEFFCTFA